MTAKQLILVTTGRICSGKGTVLSCLRGRYAYGTLSVSDVLRDALEPFHREHLTRADYAAIGAWAREQWGMDAIIRAYFWQIRGWFAPDSEHATRRLGIIDSIRTPEDLAALRALAEELGVEMRVMAVVADEAIRYERWRARVRDIDQGIDQSPWAFRAIDTAHAEEKIRVCVDVADIVVHNNGALEDFREKIESCVQALGFKRMPEGD